MSDDLHLAAITSRADAVGRLPNGAQLVSLLSRLGLWSRTGQAGQGERVRIPSKVSHLGPDQLSDTSAAIVHELGLVYELCGALDAAGVQLRLQDRKARAAARSRLRNEWPKDAKAPTKTELDDRVEDDTAVLAVEDQAVLQAILKAGAAARRDALILAKEMLSREVTYRGDQMRARLY